MTLMDPIADALISIKNSETASKQKCFFKPASKLLGKVLKVMKAHGYIDSFERLEDGKSGSYSIYLGGKINECKAIKPRHAVKKNEFEKFEKRYLPAKNMGIIIVSTPEGLLTHTEAKNKGIGGRLIAFVY